MNKNKYPDRITVATLPAPEIEIFSLIKDGEKIYVYDAVLIRLLSQVFRAPYKVLMPSDGAFGSFLPNGSWTGMVGMVKRSEADLAVGGTNLDMQNFGEVDFSYPYLFSDLTFVTDKPKPLSTSLTLFYPFTLEVWVLIALAAFIPSFFIYKAINGSQSYSRIFFTLFGTLLEKSANFKIRKLSLRLILGAWFIFTFIAINSYKSVLLSFLTIPSLSGIKDFPDLDRAAEKNSVVCYAFTGVKLLPVIFLESERKFIGKCLQKNSITFEVSEELFIKAPPNKAFISGRVWLMPFARDLFISEDSYKISLFGFPISSDFCCKKYLNEIIHRLFATGVFQKLMSDEHMALMFHLKTYFSKESDSLVALRMSDLEGAFLILIAGYILSVVTLVIEISIRKYGSLSKFRIF